MNDLDRQLTDHLRATAALMDGPSTTADGIRRRAQRRRRRRSTMGAVAALVVLGGAGVVAISTNDGVGTIVDAAGPAASTVPTPSDSDAGVRAAEEATTESSDGRSGDEQRATPMSTGPVGAWTEVELPSGVEPWTVVPTNDGFYAASAPFGATGVLYRSRDGREWTELPSSPAPNVWTISASSELIAVVGIDADATATDSGSPDPVIWTSTDQGVSWQPVALPPSNSPVISESPFVLDSEELGVLVRGTTLVVTRSTWRGIDDRVVLDELGIGDDDVQSMAQTDDRFIVTTVDGKSASITFEELGIDSELTETLGGSNGVDILTSVNGGPIDVIDRLDDADGAMPVVNPDAFVVNIFSDRGEARWRSDDGVAWDVDDTVAGTVPSSSGTADVFSFRARELSRSSPGSAPEPLVEIDPPFEVSGVAASGDTIVVSVISWFEPALSGEAMAEVPDATLSKDGLTLVVSFADNRVALIDDASGSAIYETPLDLLDESGEAAGIEERDDGSVLISDPITGEPLFEFDEAEFEAANADTFVTLEEAAESGAVATYAGDGDGTTVIGVSVDGGLTWGWQLAEAAFGDRAGWVNLISDGTRTLAIVDGPSGSGLFVLDDVVD